MAKGIKLIAETAMHHEGNLEYYIKLINKIVNETNTDFVKLHLTMDLDEYMTKDHPLYVKSKGWLFTKDEWLRVLKPVQDSNKNLLLLLNDTTSVQFASRIKPEMIEIHSTCLNDIWLLEAVKQLIPKSTKIVIGTGGSTKSEIDSVINYLDWENIILMHGFQNYPTKYRDINFFKIMKLKSLYPTLKHGYADHTAWNHENNLLITLFGAATGMEYIEKHVTFDFGVERTDWSAAINLEMFNKLKEQLTLLDACNGNGDLDMNTGEKQYSTYGPMKKAGILVEDVVEGSIFKKEQVTFKRTAEISDLSQIQILNNIGSFFSKNLKAGSILNERDFTNVINKSTL